MQTKTHQSSINESRNPEKKVKSTERMDSYESSPMVKFQPIFQNPDVIIKNEVTPAIDGDDTARRVSIVNSENANTPQSKGHIVKTPPSIKQVKIRQ